MRRSDRPSLRRRLATGLGGLLGLLASTILAEGFDLNGSQYHGWVRTFSIFAFLTIPWTLAAMRFQPRLSLGRIGWAGLGLFVATTAVAITVWRYADPYQGSHRWPDALAWLGLVALLAVPAALSVPDLRRDRDGRSPSGS
jgi:hypothetical protein